MRLISLALACCSLGISARAATIPFYVDALNGSDSNNGSSPATAWRTVTHALSVVGTPPPHNFHEIVLLPGVYDEANGESFPLVLGPGRGLVSSSGAMATIVGTSSATQPSLRIVAADPHGYPVHNSQVRGLTLRGGSPCVAIDDAGPLGPLLQYVILEDLVFGYSTGPHLHVDQRNASTTTLTGSRMRGLSNAFALEIASGDVRVDRVDADFGVPIARVATVAGGHTTLELRRVRGSGAQGVVVEPLPGSGATSVLLADSYLRQCTNSGLRAIESPGSALDVVVERTTIRGCIFGGVEVMGGSLTLHDSILYGNFGDVRLLAPAPVVVAGYCLIGDGTFAGQNGCFAADPLFLDDGRLSAGSPAADAADPASSMSQVDLRGLPRDVDGDLDAVRHPDIGAFEHRPLEMPLGLQPGGTLQVDVFGPAGAPAHVYWTRGGLASPGHATREGLVELRRDRVQPLALVIAGPMVPGTYFRAIPADPAFVGQTFAFQARMTTGGVPASAWTNAIELTVTPGSRGSARRQSRADQLVQEPRADDRVPRILLGIRRAGRDLVHVEADDALP